jgi:glycosyltransferase involved in cell wall biosynthesis
MSKSSAEDVTSPHFSLIICCYNSAERIQPTIEHILCLKLPESVSLEVIIVDNNCSDETGVIIERLWNREQVPLRFVKEPKPGLMHARNCGIEAARGELLVFVDDDNWLEADYLVKVHQVFQDRPEVGIVGGCSLPEFGKDKPEWFDTFAGIFAVSAPDRQSGLSQAVFGAGICLRKQIFVQLAKAGFNTQLIGRQGDVLSSGEDSELCYAACLLGWKVWYESEAKLKHYIPEARLTESYLEKLNQGIGQSGPILAVYAFSISLKPLFVYMRAVCSWVSCNIRAVVLILDRSFEGRIKRRRLLSVARAWKALGLFGINRILRQIGGLKAFRSHCVSTTSE